MENEQLELSKEEQESIYVQSEMEALFGLGKEVFNHVEISEVAPTIYDILMEEYQVGEANGIVTDTFSLIELKDEPETFKITKK